jgi:hypothetical protein
MSTWQDAQKALGVAQVVIAGIESIESVLGMGQSADAIVKAISAIISTVKAGASGQVTASEVTAALQTLQDQLAAEDAVADAAVNAKFPTT